MTKTSICVVVTLLCGGSGERFVPLSDYTNKCLVGNPYESTQNTLLESHIVAASSAVGLLNRTISDNYHVDELIININTKTNSLVAKYVEYKYPNIRNSITNESEGIYNELMLNVSKSDLPTNAHTLVLDRSTYDSTDYSDSLIVITDPTIAGKESDLTKAYYNLLISQVYNNDLLTPSLIVSTKPTESKEYFMKYVESDSNSSVLTTISYSNDLKSDYEGYSLDMLCCNRLYYNNLINSINYNISDDNQMIYWSDSLYVSDENSKDLPTINLIKFNTLSEFDTIYDYLDLLDNGSTKFSELSYVSRRSFELEDK